MTDRASLPSAADLFGSASADDAYGDPPVYDPARWEDYVEDAPSAASGDGPDTAPAGCSRGTGARWTPVPRFCEDKQVRGDEEGAAAGDFRAFAASRESSPVAADGGDTAGDELRGVVSSCEPASSDRELRHWTPDQVRGDIMGETMPAVRDGGMANDGSEQPSALAAAHESTLPAPNTPAPWHGPHWTGAKRVAFLDMLSATHNVAAAARSVGMSRQSAYRLRTRLRGSAFDEAWMMALSGGFDALAHAALDRALNGVEVPHYHRGELVGTSRRYDERLTIALLAMRGAIAPARRDPGALDGEDWRRTLARVCAEARRDKGGENDAR